MQIYCIFTDPQNICAFLHRIFEIEDPAFLELSDDFSVPVAAGDRLLPEFFLGLGHCAFQDIPNILHIGFFLRRFFLIEGGNGIHRHKSLNEFIERYRQEKVHAQQSDDTVAISAEVRRAPLFSAVSVKIVQHKQGQIRYGCAGLPPGVFTVQYLDCRMVIVAQAVQDDLISAAQIFRQPIAKTTERLQNCLIGKG